MSHHFKNLLNEPAFDTYTHRSIHTYIHTYIRTYTRARQNGVLGVQNQSGVQSGVQITLGAKTRYARWESMKLGRKVKKMIK